MLRLNLFLVVATALSSMPVGLGCSSTPAPTAPAPDRLLSTATAKLEARSGSTVTGTVSFTERTTTVAGKTTNVVDVRYDITGLVPGETRGFHVHDVGDCSAPDAASAGGHFNPGGHNHGAMTEPMSHAGDLGNVTANPAGRAEGLITGLSKITLEPGANSILGRSVIVHQKADDYTTQPTGNAGPRVACGVIVAD